MSSVLSATAFLTRVRVGANMGTSDVGKAAPWFPLVGAGLGSAGALVAWTTHDLMAVPSLVTATLVVGAAAWITGALHLDGLADTIDGLGGGRTRDDVLRIMRDSAIGSYGTIALVIVIAMKIFSLAALLDRRAALPFLVAAPALSRWTICLLAGSLPYARADGGLGHSVTSSRSLLGFLISTTVATVIAIATLRLNAIAAIAVALLTTLGVGRIVRRRIGGVTGDVFGACVELTETAVLLMGVLLTGLA